MRETADVKARNLLANGLVTIHSAGPWFVAATVHGSSGLYITGYEHGGWHCTCPCRGRCSHIIAVQLTTDVAQSVRAVAS
jgi:hypothetical protein